MNIRDTIKASSLAPKVGYALRDWIQYRLPQEKFSEKKVADLITIAKDYEDMNGELPVAELIDTCRHKGYKQIYWDRLRTQPAERGVSKELFAYTKHIYELVSGKSADDICRRHGIKTR